MIHLELETKIFGILVYNNLEILTAEGTALCIVGMWRTGQTCHTIFCMSSYGTPDTKISSPHMVSSAFCLNKTMELTCQKEDLILVYFHSLSYYT